MLEFRQDRGSLQSLTRMLLVAVAVVVSIALLVDALLSLLLVSPPPVKNDVGLVRRGGAGVPCDDVRV